MSKELKEGEIYRIEYPGVQLIARYESSDICHHFFHSYLHYWSTYESYRLGGHCTKAGIVSIQEASMCEAMTLKGHETRPEEKSPSITGKECSGCDIEIKDELDGCTRTFCNSCLEEIAKHLPGRLCDTDPWIKIKLDGSNLPEEDGEYFVTNGISRWPDEWCVTHHEGNKCKRGWAIAEKEGITITAYMPIPELPKE
jgi:hypothetical protein